MRFVLSRITPKSAILGPAPFPIFPNRYIETERETECGRGLGTGLRTGLETGLATDFETDLGPDLETGLATNLVDPSNHRLERSAV